MSPAEPSPPLPSATIGPSTAHARQRSLVVRNLTAGYGTQTVVAGASFEVETGATLVILGNSGCGKTTLLKAIAGLVPISSGEIELESLRVDQLPPGQREIIYLDQEPLLFEHLSVRDNIAFAPQLRGRPAAEVDRDVREMFKAIDLAGHERKRDSQLSGGQKQRVAFARAILARPRLLLLDEPFCNLDGRARGQMQALFADLSRRFALTSIFVTHDVKEALIVGNQYARMSNGRLRIYSDRQSFISDEQTGIPSEIAFWHAVSRRME
jgi:putrescine transport system ATP-binding protein